MQIYILSPANTTLCALSSKGDALDTFNFYNSNFVMNLVTPNTFEFTCSMMHPNSKHIIVGNQVIFKYDGEYHLFKIIEVEATHSSTHEATCYCEGASLELINSVVLPATMPQATAEQALNTILTNTEWKLGEVDQFETKDIEFTNYNTVLSELTNLAELYGAEVKYRLGFNPSSGVNEKLIDFKHNIGRISGVRFEYGVNTTDVTRKVNSNNVCTAVIPIGNDDLTIKNAVCTKATFGFDKAQGQIYVGLPEDECSAITNSPYHIFSTLNIETDDPYKLCVKAWEYLQDNKTPYVEYTFNPVKLGEEVNVGDEVYCIDREMKIQVMATVAEYSVNFNDSTQNSVTLKNFIPLESSLNTEIYNQIQAQIKNINFDSNVIIGGTRPEGGDESIIWVDIATGEMYMWNPDLKIWELINDGYSKTEVDVIVDEINGLIATKISETAMKEYVDESIENIEGMDLTPIEERLTVNESNIQQLSGEISLKVSQETYDGDMENFGERLTQAESSIQVNANGISSKVSKNGVISAINQSSESVVIDADKINLNGLTTFTSTGSAGTVSIANGEVHTKNTGSDSFASLTDGNLQVSSTYYTTIVKPSGIYFYDDAGAVAYITYDPATGVISISNLEGDTGIGDGAIKSVNITGTGNTIANATFSNGVLTLEKLYRVNSHSVTGSGNAVTDVSLSNGQMTFTKGSTFSVSGHNHTVNTSGSGNVVTGVSSSGGVITVTKGTISSGSSFTGGTLSSTLYTRGVVPTSDSSYDVGSGSAYYANVRGDTMYSSNYASASDERLKENIQDINVEKCVKLINGLDVKTFNYIKTGKPSMGFIAQDIVMQDHYDTDDYFTDMIVNADTDNEEIPLALNYNQFIMPLVVTVQEHKESNWWR